MTPEERWTGFIQPVRLIADVIRRTPFAGALLWLGLRLRDGRLRALPPLRAAS